MKRNNLFLWFLLMLTSQFSLQGQVIHDYNRSVLWDQLDSSRAVNWFVAGLRDTNTSGFIVVDLSQLGVVNDGVTPNDLLLDSILQFTYAPGLVLLFPEGDFLFQNTIHLPSNCVVKGAGPTETEIIFNLSTANDGFQISGTQTQDTATIMVEPIFRANRIVVDRINFLHSNDWIKIIQNDAALITSDWALTTVGQIVQVDYIQGDTVFLKSEIRYPYILVNNPKVIQLNMKSNIGIECLKISRVDNTAPVHTANISIQYGNNIWIKGIESENCNFAHIDIRNSSNVFILKSYIHHSFEYGGDGRGYGVMIHYTSNECKVEDNIFNHLRHSMILQAGSNGNAFSFNYSFAPYWTNSSGVIPSDAAGDMVLHGNFPYANLFEQNVCQNIVVDNSHGANGKLNTFLRNRCEKYGIFFSDATSPGQNFLGNEIVNTSFPYSLVNYTILGTDHFLYGNNNKGTISPSATANLTDSSYAYHARPSFVPLSQWIGIGPPNSLNQVTENPAKTRYLNQQIFLHSCYENTDEIIDNQIDEVLIYPNPTSGMVTVNADFNIKSIKVFDICGKLVFEKAVTSFETKTEIDLSKQKAGLYFVNLYSGFNKKIVKVILF